MVGIQGLMHERSETLVHGGYTYTSISPSFQLPQQSGLLRHWAPRALAVQVSTRGFK